jgi:hypothetical protein
MKIIPLKQSTAAAPQGAAVLFGGKCSDDGADWGVRWACVGFLLE